MGDFPGNPSSHALSCIAEEQPRVRHVRTKFLSAVPESRNKVQWEQIVAQETQVGYYRGKISVGSSAVLDQVTQAS